MKDATTKTTTTSSNSHGNGSMGEEHEKEAVIIGAEAFELGQLITGTNATSSSAKDIRDKEEPINAKAQEETATAATAATAITGSNCGGQLQVQELKEQQRQLLSAQENPDIENNQDKTDGKMEDCNVKVGAAVKDTSTDPTAGVPPSGLPLDNDSLSQFESQIMPLPGSPIVSDTETLAGVTHCTGNATVPSASSTRGGNNNRSGATTRTQAQARPGAYSNIRGVSSRLLPANPRALFHSLYNFGTPGSVTNTSTTATATGTGTVTSSTSANGTDAGRINHQHHDPEAANSNTEGLVEAKPVSEENNVVLARAHEHGTSSTRPKRPWRDPACVGIAVAVFVALLVIVLALALSLPNDTTAPQSSTSTSGQNPTATTSTDNHDVNGTSTTTASINAKRFYLRSLLPDYTLQAIDNNASSPQALSLEWILNDPKFNNHTAANSNANSEFNSSNTNANYYYYDIAWRIRQRFALAAFYHSTNGPQWNQNKDWLSYDIHECQWTNLPSYLDLYGAQFIEVPACAPFSSTSNTNDNDNANNTESYKRLWFAKNSLRGPLPPELYWLTDLQSLDFRENNLTGTLSSMIGQLTNLDAVIFQINNFTGSIPSEFGLLSKLTTLSFRGDVGDQTQPNGPFLSGTIPSQLGLLTKLQRFGISRANIQGTIPTELFRLTLLQTLDLTTTYLSGLVMPTELGLLTDLFFLYLYNNTKLGGIGNTIPSEIGKLTKVQWLRIALNNFTGTLPSEIGLIESLKELSVDGNQLTSTIPSELGLIPSISRLGLSFNDFQGPLPFELGRMSRLQVLDVSYNALTGSIPTSLGDVVGLEEIYFQSNNFTGTIPAELRTLPVLKVWNSANNSLSGTIPGVEDDSLMELSWQNISHFNVAGNSLLVGSIPEELCDLNASHLIFDCSNQLCGCSRCLCAE